jgi:hypothetical protein
MKPLSRLFSRIIPAGLVACQPGAAAPAALPASHILAPDEHTKPISFSILEDYDKGRDLAEIARDFALFRELGVPVWRGSFGWDDYEPEPGQYDFVWLDRFASLADSMGIALRPYVGYTPEWASQGGRDEHAWNDPPGKPSDWVRFVESLATRLRHHPSIRSYEIYNEENAPLWWEGTAEEYAVVLRLGARAIRRADPDAQVLLGGMVWPDANWLETACDEARSLIDVIPFHAYPETWTADSVTIESYLGSGFRDRFVRSADQNCGRKPIWINEAGFATVPGKTEEEQAEWWVRAFATFLAQPRIEHLGIYEIRDQLQGTEVIGEEPNYYLGLIRQDGTPKLAFRTVKLLLQLFQTDSIRVADEELRVRLREGKAGKLYQHLFARPDGRQLVFAWSRKAAATVELELRRPGSRVSAFQLNGDSTRWTDTDGRVIRGVRLEPGRVRMFRIDP